MKLATGLNVFFMAVLATAAHAQTAEDDAAGDYVPDSVSVHVPRLLQEASLPAPRSARSVRTGDPVKAHPVASPQWIEGPIKLRCKAPRDGEMQTLSASGCLIV